jgi:hypothetical protein
VKPAGRAGRTGWKLLQLGLAQPLDEFQRPMLAMVLEVYPTGIAVQQAAALVLAPQGSRGALAVDTALAVRAVGLAGSARGQGL